jgi:hypothetical protein
MSSSLVAADSILAIDVGAVNTRAVLFDVVEGRYRFIATGTAPSTAGAPFRDVGEGVQRALEQLQQLTGRKLMGNDQRLIFPSLSDGSGVDGCVVTTSAGPPLRVVAVGLLEDISVESAQHLANTTYAQVVDILSLNDRRGVADRLDSILRLRPDLIIVAGGAEQGASQSVMNLFESVGLACYLMPEGKRPEVLYAGNQSIAAQVKSSIEHITPVHIAPNIRPALETEQLGPAQAELSAIYRVVRTKKINGMQELDQWSGGRLMPTASAFGRTIRFLSKIHAGEKGVLGIDVGATATTVAAAFAGELTSGIYPQLGLGEGLTSLLNSVPAEEILRWMPVEVPEQYLRDYLFNKALYPASLPATAEDLAIEQSLARQVIRLAVRRMSATFRKQAGHPGPGFLPWFEPIVAMGSVITQAPTRGQSLLMLLDALQPVGVTVIALDSNFLTPALGAAASINTILPTQALEISNLGTVISPVGEANYGTPILRVRVTDENGNITNVQVKYGALEVISLPAGQSAVLQLQPLHRFDVGMGGPGKGGQLHKVVGGSLGLIIDARGRPVRLPPDAGRRRELIKKWLWALGG